MSKNTQLEVLPSFILIFSALRAEKGEDWWYSCTHRAHKKIVDTTYDFLTFMRTHYGDIYPFELWADLDDMVEAYKTAIGENPNTHSVSEERQQTREEQDNAEQFNQNRNDWR
jgi:fatty-acid desaturase